MVIGVDGSREPAHFIEPRRGQLAFQKDLLLRRKNDKIPLVSIEIKIGGFSTHDVLIYSTKAVKHKQIYPYLRCGFIVGHSHYIQKRFFIHNLGYDFAMAISARACRNNAVYIYIYSNI